MTQLRPAGSASRQLEAPARAAGPQDTEASAAPDAGLLAPVWAGTRAAVLTTDRAWLQAMLDTEVALARAQSQLGLVPVEAVEIITGVARAERFELGQLARAARGAANPVVTVVAALTAAVAVVDPDAANYVHRGSTSQDILDTASLTVVARVLELVLADLDRICRAFAALAELHRDTVLAGRTLGQHAVPTTFGLKVAGWLQGVSAARARVATVASALPVSLGGAAGTLAGYLEYARLDGSRTPAQLADFADGLIAAFATETGLAEPVLPWHTNRLPILDVASALTAVTGALGKVAVDVQLLSRTEVGEVGEPALEGRGVSSAMPQKCNPVMATLILSAAQQLPGLLSNLAACLLAADERPAGAWHAEWQPLREGLRLAGGASETAVELAEGLVVRPERMRANLELTGGSIVSERLAVALAPRVGKAAAKALVTKAVVAASRSGRPLAEELNRLPELSGTLEAREIDGLLDPAAYLGAAGHLVDRALAAYRRLS